MGGNAMKKYCLLLALFLGACATAPAVQTPVAVPCPPPPAIERPRLPVSDLRPSDSPDAVMKALVVSVEKLTGYARELEEALKGYRQ
jgi:hypothetical protein